MAEDVAQPLTAEESVHVLWTSGWDSTFRVAQLLLDGSATVQPWYVRDPDRPSTAVELKTLDLLRRAFAADDRFHLERLAPLRVVAKRAIAPDAEITTQFQSLRSTGYWGSQYEWLARLATMERVRFEIGLKADDMPIRRLGGLVVPLEHGLSRFEIDPSLTDDELGDLRLFRSFVFPVADLTKLDMKAHAEQHGFDSIMEQTWFCHTPLIGRPCGECAPCRHTRDEGFGWRVPPSYPTRRFVVRATRRIRRGVVRLRGAVSRIRRS